MRPSSDARIHRIEVRPSARAGDPLAQSVLRSARSLGVTCAGVATARVYLLQADLTADEIDRLRDCLLTDPVLEESSIGARPAAPGDRIIEVHPLPGVMDPAAQTVREAVRSLTGKESQVVTGLRYDLSGVEQADADRLRTNLLANPVIEASHEKPWTPAEFPGLPPPDQRVRRVAVTTLSDSDLTKLSREGHLFLSLEEMQAVRDHFREKGREPTDVELETIAQTWSEHCVHKTLKSTVRYREEGTGDRGTGIRWEGRPGVTVHPDGSVTIRNLLKSTVAAATHELIDEGLDWALSVFVDNAGVIAFDNTWAVNVKVETHNRPSAIEPYGGAATGIGGCIRDVIGTGLGAKPIANTDVFCVAKPDLSPLPPGVLHPKRILSRVVEGVRDYGNRMGIPTVNGAVYFDDRYVGNPLVFCGCVGIMPRDRIRGEVKPGDRIIALGGRTGRDGIHGATFSSAEITHTHADEFAHAVQIGNAIEEKRLLDAILRARDHAAHEPSDPAHQPRPLYSAITDCGAGGFSSAIGEMASQLGAEVNLERAPLKYEGLRYDEIWISESQERMILAVPQENIAPLQAICREEGVELADLGAFGTPTREIILRFNNQEVGRLSCDFLHEGIPMPTRDALWSHSLSTTISTTSSGTGVPPVSPVSSTSSSSSSSSNPQDLKQTLLALLAHPNIASKRWIIRQYDHEVQGNTIIKPLVGPGGIGPGDAAVIRPVPGSMQGLAIACGLATPVGDPALAGDPYLMAIAAVDECVRNLVCVGADPERIAILDNFCWPSCDHPRNMAALVRAAVGCYDAAKAYRTPFISGKDSLNNQFRYTDPATNRDVTIEIPPTLLITGVGIVPDVARCVTMELKRPGSLICLLSAPTHARDERSSDAANPVASPHARTARHLAELIRRGIILAAHDCSEGGWLVALAEMLIASSNGAGSLGVTAQHHDPFAEHPGRYLIEVDPRNKSIIEQHPELQCNLVGTVDQSAALTIPQHPDARSIPLADLRRAFLGTLDW